MKEERPDLTAWRRRNDLRQGSRTSPVPSKKQNKPSRKPKHPPHYEK